MKRDDLYKIMIYSLNFSTRKKMFSHAYGFNFKYNMNF